MSVSTFDLEIPDPVPLLNAIAERYESAARILMEYIDNSLDDAEELFRANGGSYPYPVLIRLHLDTRRHVVTVSDNCRGMTRETLKRIVQRVGESTKRGCTWVNGQFGFGVHAYRAAARKISFITRNQADECVTMQFRRNEHRNLTPPQAAESPFANASDTGTVVTIGPFDSEWKADIALDAIKGEIELHFERLLARPNLIIEVKQDDGEPVQCLPYDYSSLSGKSFAKQLIIGDGGEQFSVEVSLKVTELPVPHRAPHFFRRGRRISEVKNIRSFMNKSRCRTSVWGHDHLIGYIEVGELVAPVITRDDFERSSRRSQLYDAILELEGELREALAEINQQQEDQSLGALESVLRRVLSSLAREDALRFRSEVIGPGQDQPVGDDGGAASNGQLTDVGADRLDSENADGDSATESDAADDPQGDQPIEGSEVVTPNEAGRNADDDGPAPGNQVGGLPLEPASMPSDQTAATRRRNGFDIKFMDLPPDAEGRHRRSRLLDGTIVLNVGHTDFQHRLDRSRHGQSRVSERLVGYLANVISIHYKDQYYEKYKNQPARLDQLFDEQVDFVCRLECALRPHIGVLQERMERDLAPPDDNGAEEA
jgi:hypothetical protein